MLLVALTFGFNKRVLQGAYCSLLKSLILTSLWETIKRFALACCSLKDLILTSLLGFT